MKNPKEHPGYLFSKGYSNFVFILLFLLYMFDYIDRVVVTSMRSSIETAYGITHTQSALLLSGVYWIIVILTLPASLLVDRWSRSKTIGIMAVMWSLATALCALTGSYIQLLMARFLIGVGEAGYAPGGTAMISGLYPIEKRSRMIGIWNASIPLGTAIGVLLGGMIATRLGWKHAFGLVAFPGFIIAVIFLFVKDYKTVDLSFVDKSNNMVKMERKDVLREFRTKPSILYSFFGITAVVFVTNSIIYGLPAYFENTRNMNQEQAGKLASYVMALALVGAPVGGYLTDLWRKKKAEARLLFPAISTLAAAVALFVALFLLTGNTQYVVLLVFGVLITMFIAGAAAVTQDVVHPGLRAISYSVAVVIQNLLGSSMGPIVTGKIYDLYSIKTALSILPFILVIGSVLFWMGSKYYTRDFDRTVKVELKPEG
ncbi:MAG TPA: MFS transporter [Bacteroidales bacterium]|nr:MFS transporter [Bacteroidales bacterium]